MATSPVIRQLCILIATLFASFSAGAGMGFPSILLYQLKRNDTEIQLDLDTASWIGSIHGLAGLPGIIAPVVMQWKGRKFTFIAACFVIISGWGTGYTANSTAMILVSETLLGFSSNVLLSVSYDCLSEMITPKYRNVAVQSYNNVNMIGLCMPGVLAMFVHWRILCIIMSLPIVVAIIMACFWLESPLWLAYMEDLDRCKNNFTKIRGCDECSSKELQEVMAAHKEKLRTKPSKRESFLIRYWRQITSRDFIKPALHVFILLNHSYWSGTIVILLYSIELITNATQNDTAAFFGGIIINLVLVLGAFLSSIIIRCCKNKSVITLSTCGATVCLLSVSIVTYLQSIDILDKRSLLVLYLLVGFMLTSSLGQSSVTFTMTAELMPVKHRGIGGAIFVIYMCLLHTTALKISPYLFVYIGMWGTFFIYSLNSITCGMLIWKYVPETKGKTLPEIENFYTHGTFEIKILTDETVPFDFEKV